jgi:hypothetical protein
MESNSIETLLLRHYGNTAPTPIGLEEKVSASIRHEAKEARKLQVAAIRLQQQRVSRRHVARLAVKGAGNAGMGLLCFGLEGLQMLETALTSQDTSQPVLP